MRFKVKKNEFLRQFEMVFNGKLARIEYAEQERKVFLTKMIVPSEIDDKAFREAFIIEVFKFVTEKKMNVVPISSEILTFVKKNKCYRSMLPSGIVI